MTYFSCQNVRFVYNGYDETVIDDVSFTLEPGSLTVLTGASGSGKTTLLQLMKPAIRPAGVLSGTVQVPSESAGDIGFVTQDPGDQVVMEDVRSELAFGLENLNVQPAEIARRIAETVHFFGIESWIDKKVAHLSGGEKQVLNLASSLIMRPTLLLLDEPTAQLDPIAITHFLSLLERIRRETGTTILMSEHRLDDVLPLATRMLHLTHGKLAFDGQPAAFCQYLLETGDPFASAVPAVTTAFYRAGATPLPLDVGDARRLFATVFADLPEAANTDDDSKERAATKDAVIASEISFRYGSDRDDVVQDLTYRLKQGGIHAIVGGNGSGKSTLLRLLVGALVPDRGKIRRPLDGRIGMLPQDPRLVLSKATVRQDLLEFADDAHYNNVDVETMALSLGIFDVLERHPYDLSGGEMQRAALAKLLLLTPTVLLLDEPVKALDSVNKRHLATVFRALRNEGKTILLVTHDLAFAADVADTTALIFDRRIVSQASTHDFFQANAFYTTDLARLGRSVGQDWVTLADVPVMRP